MLTPSQSIYLASSAEFSRILAEDPHLKDLEAETVRPEEELPSILEFLPGWFRDIGSLRIGPLTPGIWAILWSIENRYVTGRGSPETQDTDEFLYLLSHRRESWDNSPVKLVSRAIGFCDRNGLNPLEMKAELFLMIRRTFKVLEMLPAPATETDIRPVYDQLWLADIVSIAARNANERASYVLNRMPLSSCLAYYILELRRKDRKNLIQRRLPIDIGREIYEYTQRLGEEFCRKKGIR